jgi:hypothetical protein
MERNPATCHAVSEVALMAAPPVEKQSDAASSSRRLPAREG